MKIAVIYGGKSSEREVSLRSGAEVLQALSSQGHEVAGFDLSDNVFEELRSFSPDVVFIGLHGRLGEDGTVQGALEVLGLPYVGSGVLASAIAIDKAMTKRILRSVGVPLAKEVVISKNTQEFDILMAKQVGESLGWPYIVKPNREGSTIGLTLAQTPEQALSGVQQALLLDTEILLEEYVAGTELTAVVIGDASHPEVIGVIEIIPKAGLYDYDSKYSEGGSQHIIPALINEETMKEVKRLAALSYQTLGCQDYGRVDFMLGSSQLVVLEVNTLPGMTKTSLVPDAARAYGLSFESFLNQLVKKAYARGNR